DYRGGPNNSVDIYASRITASGALAPGWIANGAPVCTAPGEQTLPRLIADRAGGAIIVWEDYPSGPSTPHVYAEHLTATGTIAPGWVQDGLLICAANSLQYLPFICPDGADGAFITWQDSRGGVFANRIAGSGTFPPGWGPNGVLLAAVTGTRVS